MRPPQPLSDSEIDHYRYALGLDGERVGMLLGVLVILAVVGAAQWALMVWVHLGAAVLGSAALALLLSFVYLGLKRASPNGSNHSHRGELPFSLLALLVLLAILGALGFGSYQLAQWTRGGVADTEVLRLWGLAVVGVPLLWWWLTWLQAYVRLYGHAQHFFHSMVTIRHDNDVPVLVRGLHWVDEARGHVWNVRLSGASPFTPLDQIAEAAVADRRDLQISELPEARVCIPKRATAFRLTWFSVVEDRLYDDVFPLPLNQLMDRSYAAYTGGVVWPGHSVQMLRGLRLTLQKGGGVLLHQGGKSLGERAAAQTGALDAAERQVLRDAMRVRLLPGGTPEDLDALVRCLRKSPLADQRLAMQAQRFRWGLQIHGFGEIRHAVDVGDVEFNSSGVKQADLAHCEARLLPTGLVVYKPLDDQNRQYVRLYITLDALALYQALLRLLGDDLKQPVQLVLDASGWRQDKLALQLRVGEQAETFAHWALRKTGTY